MSGFCLWCGKQWRYHGSACEQPQPVEMVEPEIVVVKYTDNTDGPAPSQGEQP